MGSLLQAAAWTALAAVLLLLAFLPRALGLLATGAHRALRRLGRLDGGPLALDVGRIDLFAAGAACAAHDVRIEFAAGSPVAAVHVREARFTGEWASLAQLLSSSGPPGAAGAGRRLPVSIRGVRVVLGDVHPGSDESGDGEGTGDGQVAPPPAHQRLTWAARRSRGVVVRGVLTASGPPGSCRWPVTRASASPHRRVGRRRAPRPPQ